MKIEFASDSNAAVIGVESKMMDIDQNKKAKLFAILSTNLYKNAKLAIIRELCSNAYDANVMAGDPEREFDITIPTYDNPTLVVRDYAIGLTAQHAEETLFSYLGSDKDSSEDFIGGWGLGSKSPMAYDNASGYSVHLYKDGVHWEYICSKTDEASRSTRASQVRSPPTSPTAWNSVSRSTPEICSTGSR